MAHVLVRTHPVVSHASNQWWCAHSLTEGVVLHGCGRQRRQDRSYIRGDHLPRRVDALGHADDFADSVSRADESLAYVVPRRRATSIPGMSAHVVGL